MKLLSIVFLSIEPQFANIIIYVFEIIVLIISIIIIIISLLQNKKAQTGLSVLNGGNYELFANSKERGLEWILSIFMMGFSLMLLIITLLISLLTKILL